MKTTEGPLGFPLTDRQAFALDQVLKALPKDDAYQYRRLAMPDAMTEVAAGERSDVSWISAEDPDRYADVIVARGMNDAQFRLNPIVTFNHAYECVPAGKSLWRKVVKDGDRRGIKAKTVYPRRPPDWPEDKEWLPDLAFTLIQAGMLNGKSVGVLPTKVHTPDDDELRKNGWTAKTVRRVVDEWLLVEYALTYLPVQQNAVVESVSKAIPAEVAKALGIEFKAAAPPPAPPAEPIPFTPISEIEKALAARLARLDLTGAAERVAKGELDRLRGRV